MRYRKSHSHFSLFGGSTIKGLPHFLSETAPNYFRRISRGSHLVAHTWALSTAGSNLTGITKDIYNAVKCMAKAVAAGEQTSTVAVLEFQNANMSLSQLGITQDEISQKALSAMLDQLGIDIPSAIHAL